MSEKAERNKIKFLNLCRSLIKREGLENLLNFLETSDFFTAPASTKFHANYEGGLCEHSINVYEVCSSLYHKIVEEYESKGKVNYEPNQITEESIAIACLFHDLGKVNMYRETQKWKKDSNNQWVSYLGYEVSDNFPLPHATKALVIVQQFMRLNGHEMLAIQWHMGNSDVSNLMDSSSKYAYSQALQVSPLISLISQADMLSTFLLEKIIVN